ncbi:NAD(P)-dependent oxidoreductase [Anaerocolumna sp. MB42-C2]|uniref:NAD(P)-dependent oxidoreductase n=1 Tax=Anaerocolumna sp. MB42-C2 TaxID=3070997 RepID=UPI0027E0F2B4|nr:NAD(P)-dependent oxidoreductase [Anaerocolumna sp. MB42-C2]WMJ89795.1 NAD(P)-dependent oxidoreductase [Anaerocolumna sp. MB42-C2]
MITSLVGYTGFVGSNIAQKNNFTYLYNSKNIESAYDTQPDLLIYSGVRAEKYLANQYPDQDYKLVEEAFENIKKIRAKKVVLISTIDVYKMPVNVDEDTVIDIKNLQPYGLNRFYLEKWIENEYENSLIIRLPGLFGDNIKKNFIYDMIHKIPNLLKEEKYNELRSINSVIDNYYINQNNGFFKCKDLSNEECIILKDYFEKIGFSALNFTDSRGKFQFYNLNFLWEHISIALKENIKSLNLATEPVSINEIYKYITGNNFVNQISSIIPNYDFKTKYEALFRGKTGYIFSKEKVLEDIKLFVEENI